MYERFELLLKTHNLSAYQVSKATGITQSTLSDWKTGRAEPRISTLRKIADHFDVTLDWLTGRSDVNENSKYSYCSDVELIAYHLEKIPESERRPVIETIEQIIKLYQTMKQINDSDKQT